MTVLFLAESPVELYTFQTNPWIPQLSNSIFLYSPRKFPKAFHCYSTDEDMNTGHSGEKSDIQISQQTIVSDAFCRLTKGLYSHAGDKCFYVRVGWILFPGHSYKNNIARIGN